MLPNLLSSTMNIADLLGLGKTDENDNSKKQGTTEGQKSVSTIKTTETKEVGRPEKDND